MKQKAIYIALILVGAIMILCVADMGYTTLSTVFSTSNPESQEQIAGMEHIGTSHSSPGGNTTYFEYYRDNITDVMYVFSRYKDFRAGMGGLTVMLDPETGLPLTYTRFLELAKDFKNSN